MPRAENRKRPPGSQGTGFGGSHTDKASSHQHGVEQKQRMDKKQELIEKMRKIQKGKSSDDVN
ncbi:hypothetical protein [Ferroacidibacillus organovorans]|uniref:Uncharacterized protein n=1 Tax=Ferroacidibacillus organovorans TaxID=1765683 RepID=A0A162U3K0_9BACL|nr:hypothetical protein [Ferroacidibacillus organovorans]KYP81374.1 hypothetical protein AYJ22_01000 [Ferroacidibacillus organovorans]OAG95161.1 hypothetical protein AYW79_01600 [Ferroacidibacillus organovorans]OPG15153.1 hypothetical protein B2M26_13455 [Ferroacidibacillus organovorans]